MTLKEHLREEALRLAQDHPDETPLGLDGAVPLAAVVGALIAWAETVDERLGGLERVLDVMLPPEGDLADAIERTKASLLRAVDVKLKLEEKP